MRLRHIKGAEELLKKSDYVIDDPTLYKGKYHSLFNNDNPIHLEIGTGKGDFIINMAKQNPNINFIGLEKFDSVLIKAIRKLDSTLPNLRLICFDAFDIESVFDKEIDTLYLNFSDPWPKAKHEKRRLTSPIFLKKYDQIFKNKNIIIQKTDNRKLFEYSLKTFTDYNYKIENISLDLHNDNIPNIKTEYETKFSSMGYPIYMVKVIK